MKKAGATKPAAFEIYLAFTTGGILSLGALGAPAGKDDKQYDDEQQHAGNHDVEIAASMPVHHVVVDDNHGPENNQRPTEKIRALDFAFPEAVERLPNFLGPH